MGTRLISLNPSVLDWRGIPNAEKYYTNTDFRQTVNVGARQIRLPDETGEKRPGTAVKPFEKYKPWGIVLPSYIRARAANPLSGVNFSQYNETNPYPQRTSPWTRNELTDLVYQQVAGRDINQLLDPNKSPVELVANIGRLHGAMNQQVNTWLGQQKNGQVLQLPQLLNDPSFLSAYDPSQHEARTTRLQTGAKLAGAAALAYAGGYAAFGPGVTATGSGATLSGTELGGFAAGGLDGAGLGIAGGGTGLGGGAVATGSGGILTGGELGGFTAGGGGGAAGANQGILGTIKTIGGKLLPDLTPKGILKNIGKNVITNIPSGGDNKSSGDSNMGLDLGDIVSGGMDLLGGFLGDKSAKDAAQQAAWRPYDIRTGMLNTQHNGNSFWIDPNSPLRQLGMGMMGSISNDLLGNSPYQGNINALRGGAANRLPGFAKDLYNYDMDAESLRRMQAAGYGQADAYNRAGTRGTNMGFNLMDNTYQDIANQRLGLLRQQARPYETRAQNALFNKQYSMGQMGTTGGALQTQAFAKGLGEADLARQLDAQTMADTLRQQDRQTGTDMLRYGQGMWNDRMGLLGDLFGAEQSFNQLGFNRAQQRLNNAQNMFGFGYDMENMRYGQGRDNLNTALALNAEMRNQLGLSGGIQGQYSNSGQAAVMSSGNPWADFMQGAAGNIDWTGIFNGSNTTDKHAPPSN